jgi:restriction system protein
VELRIPSDVRVVLGRTRFAKSTGTRDKRQAINKALPILTEWQQLITTARENPELIQPKPDRPVCLHDAAQGLLGNWHSQAWLDQLKPSQAKLYDAIEWCEGVSLPTHMCKFIEAHYTRHRTQLEAGDVESVEDYCRLVLSSSHYPGCLPSEFDLQFTPENRMLVVEFRLPSIEDIPSLTEVTFVVTRGELKEKHLPSSKRKQLFNDVCYQLSLRTIHELFEADVKNQISAISFNGFVSQRSSATGKLETSCIMTLQASKDEFLEIDLSHVNPKECFKGLKGIGSANLAGITPVKPILELDKSDSRFQEGYEVARHIDDTTNLAAMDWLDFENLVRELFEAEFAVSGGEVKVTQASADKGVDAIAFDPDPIRGGKIVIQAKRYTNTVGVSAVRDLYGTLMNEGANKGILVTTSDYGPDSYDFAKDKPITLLNGGNLLSLLEKHGTKAIIDIKAAKAEQASGD